MEKKLRYIVIITIGVVLDIVLHILSDGYSGTAPEFLAMSYIAERIGGEGAAILWAVLSFSGVAFVFYKFEHRINGTKLTKGLRYGFAIGLIWLIAMLEGVALFGNPFINEFVVGLSDFIPVLVVGILLSVFTSSRGSLLPEPEFGNVRNSIIILATFTFIYFLGKHVAYYTEITTSGYKTNSFLTAVWTLSMGLAIGVSYILLHSVVRNETNFMKSIKFGVWVFGVTWTLFLIFMPLLFKGFLIDVLIRITIDAALVIMSCYCSETIISRINSKKELVVR